MAYLEVQSAHGDDGVSSATQAVAITTANVTLGNRLIVVASPDNAATALDSTSTITDNAGNVYSQHDFGVGAANQKFMVASLVVPANIAGTKPTITATWKVAGTNTAIGYHTMAIVEVSGLNNVNGAGALDAVFAHATGAGVGPATATMAYPSAASNEFVFCAYLDTGQSRTATKGSTFTQDVNNTPSGNLSACIEHKNSTSGTYEVGDWTESGSVTGWACAVGVFLLAGQVHKPIISAVGTMYTVGGSSVTDLAITPVAVGDAFLLNVTLASLSITPTSVSGGGCTWVSVMTPWADGVGQTHGWFLGTVTAAGAATLTVTFSSSISGIAVRLNAQEFASEVTSPVWAKDGTQSGTLANASSTTVTFPTLTAAAAGDLYVGYAYVAQTGSAGATSGFVYQLDPGHNPYCYNLNALAGSVSATATQAPAGTSQASGVLITCVSQWPASADGAVVVSGAAAQSGTFVLIAAGGSRSSGSVVQVTGQVVAAAGSVIVSGAAVETDLLKPIVINGSVIVSGAAAQTGARVQAASGAALASGSAVELALLVAAAAGAVLVAGAAAALALAVVAATGAARASGSAVETAPRAVAATGAVLVSGAAVTAALAVLAAAGAVLVSGAAAARGLEVVAATGAVLVSGSAATLAGTVLSATGAVKVSAAAVQLVAARVIASAAVLVSGTAAALALAVVSATGTALVSGAGADALRAAQAAGGVVVVSGAASAVALAAEVAAGAVIVSGALAQTAAGVLAANGAALVSASAGALVGAVLAGAGAAAVSGAAGLFVLAVLAAVGAVIVSGAAAASALALIATGAVVVSGRAFADPFGTFAIGAARASGQAGLAVVVAGAASGTAVVTGGAAPTGAGAPAASGAVVGRGAASLVAILVPSAVGVALVSGSSSVISALLLGSAGSARASGAASVGTVTFLPVTGGLVVVSGSAALFRTAPANVLVVLTPGAAPSVLLVVGGVVVASTVGTRPVPSVSISSAAL